MVVHSSLIDNGTLVSQGLVVSGNHMASTGCKGLSVDASIQFMHHQFSSNLFWPQKDDFCWIPIQRLVWTIETPWLKSAHGYYYVSSRCI